MHTHFSQAYIISQFDVIYGQGTVIYALKNSYTDILVIYKPKSYIYVVFLKSYMVKGTVIYVLKIPYIIILVILYMNSNHAYMSVLQSHILVRFRHIPMFGRFNANALDHPTQ